MPDTVSLWPEIVAADHVRQCQCCELAGQRARVIWGEGNPSAPVLIVLDNPGAREDKEGVPFTCGTRQALYHAIAQSGLHSDEVSITYLLKCRPRRKYDREAAIAACLPYLHQQIEKGQPSLMVCMGNTVAKALVANDTDVKAIRGQWLNVMGLPCLVTYHPLAARRRPILLQTISADLSVVARRLHD